MAIYDSFYSCILILLLVEFPFSDWRVAIQQVHLLMIYIWNFHVLSYLLLIYICKLHWNLNTMFVCQVNSLLIYLCYFHVLSNFLIIYICKLHWNQIRWNLRLSSRKSLSWDCGYNASTDTASNHAVHARQSPWRCEDSRRCDGYRKIRFFCYWQF